MPGEIIKNINISTLPNYASVTPGEHTLEVIAKGRHYHDSDPSTSIVYNKLHTVSDESVANDEYEFISVLNAFSYEIYASDESGNIYFMGTMSPYNYTVDNGVVTLDDAPYTVHNGVVRIE